MAGPHLFRRRQVWLPTIWGWLALLGIAGIVCVLAGRYVHLFLAPSDPARGATLLVVEGWMSDDELDQAVAVYRAGNYNRIVTTGGPVEARRGCAARSSYAALAASYLKAHGLNDVEVTAVPAPASAQDRTYLSAVMVRDWATTNDVTLGALDLFSAGAHARRSRILYQMAFGPSVAVGVLSARPRDYDPRHWWRTSAGATSVIEETLGLLWTACCFQRPVPGTHEEKWAAPPQATGR